MTATRTRIALAIVLLALLAGGLWLYHYLPDDTFITLRYARNVIRGDGFTYNPGERVEGYTNFLWLLLLVAAGKLGAPLLGAARALGLVFALATLVLAWRAARAATPPEERGEPAGAVAIALPLLLLAAAPPFLVWSLSGTEMPLYAFLLLAGFLLVERGDRPAAAFAVFGLLGLARPEGTLLYAVAFATLLARARRRGPVLLAGLGIAAVFFAPYAAWKTSYFGDLLPNTFYAKTGPPALMLRNGARYLAGFLASHGYLLVLGLALLRRAGRPVREIATPAAFAAAAWLAVLVLGGDWMPHWRLCLPTLPIAALVAARGVAATLRNGRRAAAAAALVALAMLPGAAGRDLFVTERITVAAFSRLGVRLSEILPPGTSIGCGSTGAVGWYTDFPVIDILGLTDRYIARHGAVVGTQPGHLKTDGAYVVERAPDLLLLGNIQIHRGTRTREQMRIKIQERDIVRQPSFESLYEFVNLPLGGGFDLSCFKLRTYFLPLGAPEP